MKGVQNMELKEKLLLIQSELKAPKNQTNEFGKYKYRSAEDILEASKPLCLKHRALLTISDDIVMLGNRFYIKAFATLTDIDSDTQIIVTALAREEETKKGMDSSQITGSTSSYARKYALNGLFDIDDTKDADATNTHGKEEKETKEEKVEAPKQIVSQDTLRELLDLLEIEDIVKVKEYYKTDDLSTITQENALKLIAKKKGKK